MGWASGSEVMNDIIDAAKIYIPAKELRRAFYVKAIEALEGQDWDTQDECGGYDVAFDEALATLHPDWE